MGAHLAYKTPVLKHCLTFVLPLKHKKTFNERDIKEDDEYKRKIHF